MQRTKEAIEADLRSHDPVRVGAAIADLLDMMQRFEAIDIAPFGADTLAPLGPEIPEQVLFDFLSIINEYPSFVPRPSMEEQVVTNIAVVLRYAGKTSPTYDAQLALKGMPDPVRAVELAMTEIHRQGLSSPRSVSGAQWLLSCLLDGKAGVRSATLRGVRLWPHEPLYDEVRESIAPQLEPDELEFLA